MINKKRAITTAIILMTLCLTVAAFALGSGTLFTSNISSTGATQGVTSMEQELLNQINGATTSIDLAIYDFNRVSIRDALITAHNRGVLVRVVADDDAYANSSYNPHYTALETAGITVIRDNRSSIMHNKFFIIDGDTVWSGSTNQTDNGYTYNHNNSTLFSSSPLADIYSVEFNEMFEDGLFGTAKSDNVTHTIDYNGVPVEIYFSPTDGGMAEVINEVNTAQDSIYFSAFFFTDDDLGDALIAKLNEGLTVEGVWDALGAGNQYSEDEKMCAAGVPIKIENFGGKLHNKFMIIDANGASPRVITGSMNWSTSGDAANDENTLIVHDGVTAQAYLTAYQELYNALGSDTLCVTGGETVTLVYLPLIQKPGSNTPVPPPSDVRIEYIVYNPDGDDVQGEYVRIKNVGGTAQNLSGWQLHDAATATHRFYFPAMTIQPGTTVRVWTKNGGDTATDLYWGSGVAIWNNTGDTATLRNSESQVVSTCGYSGGGVDYICP